MKAVEVAKQGKLAIVERPMPEIHRPKDVLINIRAVGICGSDVHIYHGTNPFATYPRIVGHEFAGEVVKVGTAVGHLQAGDKVTVDPVVACGHCYACKIGRRNVCQNINVLGVHRDGGFQEFIVVDADQAYKLPDNIPWEHAALVEPFTIAAQSTARGRLAAADTVLICGAGPMGVVILQAAKMAGAKVAILDKIDSRLEQARALGADLAINSSKASFIEEVNKFTANDGASLIFEATGSIKILEMCIEKFVANAGRIVVLGMSPEPAQIAPLDFMRREMEIIGTRLNCHKFPTVVDWFSKGLVKPEVLISHTFKIDAAQAAMDLIDNHPEEVRKIVLTF
jgi:Threonine dehydrogenase and related Zn-dependent dehydrogenases